MLRARGWNIAVYVSRALRCRSIPSRWALHADATNLLKYGEWLMRSDCSTSAAKLWGCWEYQDAQVFKNACTQHEATELSSYAGSVSVVEDTYRLSLIHI